MPGNDNQANIDSTNIFDEFSNDQELKDELKSSEAKQSKSLFHYFGYVNVLLKIGNFVLFLVFVGLAGYFYVQNNEDMYNTSYLNPFCKILLPVNHMEENCSGVSALIKENSAKYVRDSGEYYKSILANVGDAYTISNYVFSKEVLFLLDRSQNRLKPLEFLEEFDSLKNKFQPFNKTKLQCREITLNDNGNIKMICETLSSDWDNAIMGDSGNDSKESVGGTSISYASSFINFLEKNATSFSVINKPKDFSYEEVVGNTGNTRKTVFELELKINNINIGLLQ